MEVLGEVAVNGAVEKESSGVLLLSMESVGEFGLDSAPPFRRVATVIVLLRERASGASSAVSVFPAPAQADGKRDDDDADSDAGDEPDEPTGSGGADRADSGSCTDDMGKGRRLECEVSATCVEWMHLALGTLAGWCVLWVVGGVEWRDVPIVIGLRSAARTLAV